MIVYDLFVSNWVKIIPHKHTMITPYSFVATQKLPDSLLDEMEMNDGPVFYDFYFPACPFEEELSREIGTRYICDSSFLETTGMFLQEWCENDLECETPPYESLQSRDDIQQTFHETYPYFKVPDEVISVVDTYGSQFPWMKSYLASLDTLNHQPWFMRAWTSYTLGSPLLSLVTPIFFMILPFFLLKLMRIQLTLQNYIVYLKKVMSGHTIGKLFQMKGSSITQKIYVLISVGFYVMNTVRNVFDCIRFVKQQPTILTNVRTTCDDIAWIRSRVDSVLSRLTSVLTKKAHDAYEKYYHHLKDVKERMDGYKAYIDSIQDKLGSNTYPSFWTIGDSLSAFYRIHKDTDIQVLYDDMSDFLGYYQVITHVVSWCKKNTWTIVEWGKPWKIEEFSPIVMLDETLSSPVKNTVDMSLNWMITGPNASGKTTVLRSMLWNQILGQQWGIMYASHAQSPIIDYFHCYLNVPDSYSRDSLFQAEARRCLEVLHFLEEHPDKQHFCIFDELYSGTNPVEATCGSIAYIQELQRKKNVRFMITTHYHDVVKYCKTIHKAYMMVQDTKYTYSLSDGVNRDYGATQVFKELGYSDKFVNRIERYIHKLG